MTRLLKRPSAVLSARRSKWRQAKDGAGQARDQDVKGAGFRLGCHGRSSDLIAQANLEHGRISERSLNSRCEFCHSTERQPKGWTGIPPVLLWTAICRSRATNN